VRNQFPIKSDQELHVLFFQNEIQQVIDEWKVKFKPIEWKVDRIHLISRTKETPFSIKHTILLGEDRELTSTFNFESKQTLTNRSFVNFPVYRYEELTSS
jgi:hypothetical protein